GTLYLRHIAELAIDGSQDVQNTGIGLQFACRAVADHHHFASDSRHSTRLRFCFEHPALMFNSAVQGDPQGPLHTFHFGHGCRTYVDSHAGRLGNRVHRGSPADDADVESRLGGSGNLDLRERLDRARQDHNGIGSAEIAPRVPTRPPHDYFETPATQRLCDNGVCSRSVQHHSVRNGVFPAWSRKNVPHSSQVAFAFLPHIANEQERQRVADAYRPHDRRNREHGGYARSVVRYAGAEQAASLLPDGEWSPRGKYRVNM